MYVITKSKISDKTLDEVGKECSKAIGRGGNEFYETPLEIYDKNRFFHVDLRAIPVNNLKSLRKTIRTFEIKYSTQVLYGEDTRNLININEKEIIALIGPNGAGKSTVIKSIFNIANVTSGEILFNEKNKKELLLDFSFLNQIK